MDASVKSGPPKSNDRAVPGAARPAEDYAELTTAIVENPMLNSDASGLTSARVGRP